MENINIGVANLIISNILKESYLNDDSLIEESKRDVVSFFDIVKNSPILQLEFKIYDNIENKFIENDLIATRYIDNNIKLFESYTIDEIIFERKKLNNIVDNKNISNIENYNHKIELYEAINTLIIESLTDYDMVDVDKIHESFTLVLNHIKQPKKNKSNLLENNNIDHKLINDDVIEIAIDMFNEKYVLLNEDDKSLFQTLIKSNITEKKKLLETYKKENLEILKKTDKVEIKDKISKAIQKINEMKYNPETIDDDIISLHEFKKKLI